MLAIDQPTAEAVNALPHQAYYFFYSTHLNHFKVQPAKQLPLLNLSL
jgi:YHS domain-containing protein